jgi:hypothetical protein
MEDTELQDELLTKPLEWSYNPIYPKKTMNSKIERQASFEMIYPDVLTNNGSSEQIVVANYLRLITNIACTTFWIVDCEFI